MPGEGRFGRAFAMRSFYEPAFFGQPTEYGDPFDFGSFPPTMGGFPYERVGDFRGEAPNSPSEPGGLLVGSDMPPIGGMPGAPPDARRGSYADALAMRQMYGGPPMGVASLGGYGKGQIANYGKGALAHYGKGAIGPRQPLGRQSMMRGRY